MTNKQDIIERLERAKNYLVQVHGYEGITVSACADAIAEIQALRGQGWQPIETAVQTPPKGVPVLVCGGIAVMKTGGEWFTGMETPLFERRLEWTPQWWIPICGDNSFPPSSPINSEGED